MQITVLDGRVLVGDFICLDKQGNIILYNTVERLMRDGILEEKSLGQVLVPAEQRKTCDVEVVSGGKEQQDVERYLGNHGQTRTSP